MFLLLLLIAILSFVIYTSLFLWPSIKSNWGDYANNEILTVQTELNGIDWWYDNRLMASMYNNETPEKIEIGILKKDANEVLKRLYRSARSVVDDRIVMGALEIRLYEIRNDYLWLDNQPVYPIDDFFPLENHFPKNAGHYIKLNIKDRSLSIPEKMKNIFWYSIDNYGKKNKLDG